VGLPKCFLRTVASVTHASARYRRPACPPVTRGVRWTLANLSWTNGEPAPGPGASSNKAEPREAAWPTALGTISTALTNAIGTATLKPHVAHTTSSDWGVDMDQRRAEHLETAGPVPATKMGPDFGHEGDPYDLADLAFHPRTHDPSGTAEEPDQFLLRGLLVWARYWLPPVRGSAELGEKLEDVWPHLGQEELGDVLTRVDRAQFRYAEELTLAATFVVGDNPLAFTETDRLRAEGEFALAATLRASPFAGDRRACA